jgi:hypothetical protein
MVANIRLLNLRPSNLQLMPWNFQMQYSYLLIDHALILSTQHPWVNWNNYICHVTDLIGDEFNCTRIQRIFFQMFHWWWSGGYQSVISHRLQKMDSYIFNIYIYYFSNWIVHWPLRSINIRTFCYMISKKKIMVPIAK